MSYLPLETKVFRKQITIIFIQARQFFLYNQEIKDARRGWLWIKLDNSKMKKMETKFLMDKPKVAEKKYQNVDKEEIAIDGRCVVQPPFHAKSSSWKGKNFVYPYYKDYILLET